MGGTMSIISQIVDVNCKNKYDENLAITDLHMPVDTKGFNAASFTPAAIDTLIRRGEEEAMRHWDEIIALKQRIGIDEHFHPVILHPLRPKVLTEKQRVTGFTFENMTPQAERFVRQKFHLNKVDSIDAKLEQQLTTTMRMDLFYQTAECSLVPEGDGVRVGWQPQVDAAACRLPFRFRGVCDGTGRTRHPAEDGYPRQHRNHSETRQAYVCTR